MSLSIRRLVRTATPASTAVAGPVPARRGPVQLQPQQLTQVAGGSPKGGWLLTTATTTTTASSTDSPKGGWV